MNKSSTITEKTRKEIERLQHFFFAIDDIDDFLHAYKVFYGMMAMKYYTHKYNHFAAQFKPPKEDKKALEKINKAFDAIHLEVFTVLKEFIPDISEADTDPPHKSE